MNGPEFVIYAKTIDFLQTEGWTVICASPPAGTDNRFRKCLLPRRSGRADDKGLRDEVDATAIRDGFVILVECKPRLSDSLTRLNALNESDFEKLKRLKSNFPPAMLRNMLTRATGIVLPPNIDVGIVLAVGEIDCDPPEGVTVIATVEGTRRVIESQSDIGRFVRE